MQVGERAISRSVRAAVGASPYSLLCAVQPLLEAEVWCDCDRLVIFV